MRRARIRIAGWLLALFTSGVLFGWALGGLTR